ncbi:MAG: DUF4126 domain-containing protein [Alphaproteobacteria bacterium]|nr:MAG: DUF4126 domain-containing protein [Alphaproteobacteria bacterium]
MTIVEILGLAASLSLLAGWRLYAAVLAAGLAMRFGVLDLVGAPALPHALAGLQVLANPWVLGIAALGTAAEFLADKVAWLDSIWDTLHTLVRPVGGALLALAVVSPDDNALAVVVFLLGGGAALASHAAKAGSRAVINGSPEPVSNVVASVAEDGLVAGGLWLALSHPEWAAALALVLAGLAALLLWLAWRILGPLWRRLWRA